MAAGVSKPMKLDVAQKPGGAVVSLAGSISGTEADRLRQALEGLAAQKVPVIVVDMGQVDYISSMGLGAIITGHLRCRHHHGQIRLARPRPMVRELLATTRLTQIFGIYDSVEQALAGQ